MGSKVSFISRLEVLRPDIDTGLYTSLREAAYFEDWDFIIEVLVSEVQRTESIQLDHLLSLVPGFKVVA